jgi:cyclic pyranopterin monophosphate synthase
MKPKRLSHLDNKGAARMVDVSAKAETKRTATAKALVTMKPATLKLISAGTLAKGDVLAAARLAGIVAAKKTSELIPLCHPLALTHVDVDFNIPRGKSAIEVTASASITGKTGVEMEALTAAAVAALTLYDMAKSAEKTIRITDLRLVEKTGGKSGRFKAK